MSIYKPRILEGREYERWLVDITDKTNSLNIDVFEYLEVTTNTTLTLDYGTIAAKTAGITLTLPAAKRNTGKNYILDNAANGDVFVSPDGTDLIEGETSQTIPPDSSMAIYCNGTGWRFA